MSRFASLGLSILALVGTLACQTTDVAANQAATATATAADVVAWTSADGIHRLERSQHKLPFFRLANQFEAQSNHAFCGPATGTIVLNALRLGNDRIKKPEDQHLLLDSDSAYLPKGRDLLFPRYTQNTFFNAATDQVKTRAEVLGKPRQGKRDGGIQLRQLQGMLAAHGLSVDLRIVDDQAKDDAVKAELIKSLSEAGRFVVVNIARPELGQKGGGHISPIGAYDDKSDSFLVLDVNPSTAPWSWVKTAALIRAMRTRDNGENRGYLLIADK